MKKFSTLFFIWLSFFLTEVYPGERKPELLAAVLGREVATVEKLLQNGASLGPFQDPRFIEGFTPLVAAVLGGSLPVIRVLLEHGADPNEGTYVTPLIALAYCKTGNELNQIVDCLLEKDADANKPNCLGITPFMVLLTHKSREMNALGMYLAVLGGICPSLDEMKKLASGILVTRGVIRTMAGSRVPGAARVARVTQEAAGTRHVIGLEELLDQQYPAIRESYLKLVRREKAVLKDSFIPNFTDRTIPEDLQKLILSMNRGDQIEKGMAHKKN